MTFLAPAWAAGLAAATLPWLAHLLGRGRGRPTRFPAAHFARAAEAETSRFLRLRETGLLAMRTAALAAIALAFMQPVWRGATPAGAADETLGRHVVSVIDRTGSMQRTEGGHALFDRARRRALAALEQSVAGDRLSAVALDRHPRALLPEPTTNRAALAERIEELPPTHEHGDVAAALRRARELHRQLDDADRRALHVELFTDAQRSQWADTDVSAAFEGLPAQVRMHRLGRFEANDALHAPAVEPSEPIVGQPARISVRATRFAEDVGRRTIELRAGDRRKTRRIELEPLVEKALDFRVRFDQPGPQVIELRFAERDDALPADDATGRLVNVRTHRPVRLLTRADTDEPATAAYFVRRALAPDDDAERTGVRLSVEPPAALPAAQPKAAGVLVLVEAGELDVDELAALSDHVAAGGAAIWVIDSADAATALERFDRVTGRSPMLAIDDAREAWRDSAPRALGTGRFDAPILAAFEGPVRAALLGQSFDRTLEAQAHDDAEVLLRFADGAPALATRSINAGRLAVFAADLGPESSGLGRGPLLVPLLHQLLRHLAAGEPAPPNPHPGEAGPGERVAQLGFQAHPDAAGDDAPDAPDGLWYELDPRQSDLRVLDERREMDRPDGAAGAQEAVTLVDASGAPDAPREVALWPWAMVVALALLMLEPIALLRRAEAQGGRR